MSVLLRQPKGFEGLGLGHLPAEYPAGGGTITSAEWLDPKLSITEAARTVGGVRLVFEAVGVDARRHFKDQSARLYCVVGPNGAPRIGPPPHEKSSRLKWCNSSSGCSRGL